MKSKIEIRREYDDDASPKRVMKAMAPDNSGAPKDTSIAMRAEGNELIIEVSSGGNLQSFLRTVDDLLLCIQAAEGAIKGSR
jgi:tRNA threonylcarbamoyladenosine modification (KEOPS) complex  Pcc1 subunit